MENTIKQTTSALLQGALTKDEADKILLDLVSVSRSNTEEHEKKLTRFQMFIGGFKGRRY